MSIAFPSITWRKNKEEYGIVCEVAIGCRQLHAMVRFTCYLPFLNSRNPQKHRQLAMKIIMVNFTGACT